MNENNMQKQTQYQNDYRVFHWPKWRTWKRIFLVLLVLLILGDVYLHIWVSKWVDEQIANDRFLTPPILQGIHEFWKKTLDYPEEWVQEKPASENLSDAYKKADFVWEEVQSKEQDLLFRLNKWTQQNDMIFTGDEENEFMADVIKIDPFVNACTELSEVMKKEAEMGLSCFDFPDMPVHHTGIITLLDALLLKARAFNLQGEFDKALESYFAMLPMMIAHPAKDFFHHFSSFLRLEKAIPEIAPLIVNVQNPDELRVGLDTLNWIVPFLFTGRDERDGFFYLLSDLNDHRTSLDLSPGKKAAEYIQQYSDLYESRRYCFSDSLSFIKDNFWSISTWHKHFTEERIVDLVRPFIFSRPLNEYMLLLATPSYYAGNSIKKEQKVELSFDILRLQIAARLYELDTGKKVSATTDLVPKYISEELVTPESQRSYQWDSEGKLIVPFFQ